MHTQVLIGEEVTQRPPDSPTVPEILKTVSPEAEAPLAPEVGQWMTVCSGAKVREGVESESADLGDLEHGEVVQVLERQQNENGQWRVRFDMGNGMAGWTSATSKNSGRQVLRPLDGEPLPRTGDLCHVIAKAFVYEGFEMEHEDVHEAGYLEEADIVIVEETRVNDDNEVRVRIELEGMSGWMGVTDKDGNVQLEALPEDWEEHADALDVQYDLDGDGMLDHEELVARAHNQQVRHAGANDDVYSNAGN